MGTIPAMGSVPRAHSNIVIWHNSKPVPFISFLRDEIQGAVSTASYDDRDTPKK